VRRFLLAYALPTMAVLAAICLPLILGQRTLYLRDVFGTHLAMKSSQAETLRAGELALVDPYRGGGQASLGNLNTVPLYPTNLLYLVGDSIWALNAHFWIHLLLAPFGLYWLARRCGLERAAAWMGAVAYGAGGYLLSTLNLYNLVAPAALAPALIAACMSLAERPRAIGFCAVTGLWVLMVLGGDPMTAAMALVMALSAVALTSPRQWRSSVPTLVAVVLGTLVALPQIVELARILPHTYRGFWGYSAAGATMASWNPLSAIEGLLPLFFGWPDLGYWGRGFYGDELPLLFSLAPGVLVIGLVLASGRPARPIAWWCWGSVALGLFLVLGRHNPILGLLLRLTRVDLIRLPVKFWLLVAIGASLLAALGFERLLRGERRPFVRALTALLALYAGLWAFLALGGAAAFGWGRRLIPTAFGDGYVEQERLRWAGLALVSMLILGAGLGVLKLSRRHPALLAILPFLHLVSQFFFLKPLLATDDVRPYLEPPALLAELPEGSTTVHGDAGGLFGRVTLPLDRYPDRSLIWFQRQTHEELYPHAGVRFDRHYELDYSPEGLDAFLTRATAQAMTILPDPARLKLLESSGVDRLLISRRLSVLEAAGQVELLEEGVGPTGELNVYGIPRRVERARLVGSIVRAPHLNGTLEVLTSPTFDARRTTVLPGTGEPTEAPPGSVRWVEDGVEEMVLEVDSPAGGALVIQRTPLPIYRAEVDDLEAPIVPADLHRIGIEVGPGPHTVRVWVDRGPLRVASLVSLLAVLGTIGVAVRLRSFPPATAA
jgi:hypothetical protein